MKTKCLLLAAALVLAPMAAVAIKPEAPMVTDVANSREIFMVMSFALFLSCGVKAFLGSTCKAA
jgi:hypothetical protein